VKARIVDDEAGRKELHARFLYAQQFAQIDPWAERANSETRSREFHALAEVA
jgi:nitrite reductase (NADH) large subunit